MRETKRLIRITLFLILSLPLLIPAGNSAYSEDNKDNLISLFYIRKDNITNSFQGEIYPVSYYSGGKYSDASIDVSGEPEKLESKSLLNRIKDFIIIDEGRQISKVHIKEISSSPFMCGKILTGKTNQVEGGSLAGLFEGISKERSSHSVGAEHKKEFDFTLKWTLAVSRVYIMPLTIAVLARDLGRYRTDVLNISSGLLAKYTSEDKKATEPEIESLTLFDLDHDGRMELSAKIKKSTGKKIKIDTATEVKEGYSNDAVYLNLWVTYKSGSPQVILSLISHEKEDSWGSGHDLVGTLDVNGDGIDEVIMRRSGYESVDFEIYEYRNDKLENVFSGAGFGC